MTSSTKNASISFNIHTNIIKNGNHGNNHHTSCMHSDVFNSPCIAVMVREAHHVQVYDKKRVKKLRKDLHAIMLYFCVTQILSRGLYLKFHYLNYVHICTSQPQLHHMKHMTVKEESSYIKAFLSNFTG